MAGDETPVTLVNGTFARKARWIQPESPMSQALRRAGCKPESFTWSGANSHIARIRAADELATRLGKRPGVPQYVIAHSHGGNVALQAVNRLQRKGDDIAPIRIISLATPFLCAARRPLARIALYQSVSGGIIAICLTAVGFGSPTSRDTWAWRIGLIIALAFVLQLTLLAGAAKVHGRLYREPIKEALLKAVNSPEVTFRNLLVIRAAGDEASGLLIGGQFVGWMSTRLLELFRPRQWGTVVGIGGLVTVIFTLINFGNIQDAFLLAAGATITFLIVLSIGVTSVLFFASLAYGYDGPALSLFAFVSAESTPPGTPEIIQLKPRAHVHSVGLAHSSLYEDPDVIGKIVENINRGRETPV